MAWWRTGVKSLHEAMMTQFTDAIYGVTIPQWVNSFQPGGKSQAIACTNFNLLRIKRWKHMQNVKHLLSILNILENHHLHWTMNLGNRMMIMHRTTQLYCNLTHSGRVTHIFAFLQYAICLTPSHYMNQCWLIVNWTTRNKFQWNLNQNTTVFIW